MKQSRFKRFATMALCIAIAISFMPSMTFAANFVDMPDNWATESLNRAVSDGLLKGYDTDGVSEIRPSGNLTRAELVTVVNRAFGAKNKASLVGIGDVSSDAWFADEIAKAINMHTMSMDTNVRPNDSITRQEAFTILARAFNLKAAGTNAISKFGDAGKVASWANDAMNALVAGGYVAGSEGNLNPTANITRAEFAKIMSNMVGGYITEAGTVTSLGSGNIIVRAGGVTIKDATITGDLIMADGVDAGTINLEGVKVTGRVLVRGGNLNADDNSTLGTIQVLSAGSAIVSSTGTVEVAEGITGVTLNGEAVSATPAEAPTETPAADAGGAGGGGGGGGGGGPIGPVNPAPTNLTIDHEGTFTGTYNNVTITSAVGDGEVVLNNMTINGTLTVQGGGSSSIKLFGTSPNRVVMNKDTSNGGQKPRLELTNSIITQIEVLQAAIIEATNRASGIGTVKAKDEVTVKGGATKVENVEVPSDAKSGVTVTVNDASVATVNNAKDGATVNGSGANIENIKTTQPMTIGGSNTVESVEVPTNAADNTAVTFQDTVKVDNVDVKKENTTVNANQSAGGRVSNIEANAPLTVGGTAAKKVTVEMAVSINLTGSGISMEFVLNVADGANVVENGNSASFSIGNAVIGLDVRVTVQANEGAEPQEITHICKWDNGVVTTNATCTTDGVKTFTCQSTEGTCPHANHQKNEVIPATGHDFSGTGTVTTEATCLTPGETTYTCKNGCGTTRTESIAMKEHTLQPKSAVPATCTGTGTKEYWECSDCHRPYDKDGNALNLKDLSVPALGHNWGTPTYEWSADKSTVTATRVCTRDASHKETETVAATSRVTTDSTCGVAGVKTYTSASFSNSAFTVQTTTEPVRALGHSMTHYAEVPATESATGTIEYWECSRCHKYFSDAEGNNEVTAEQLVIPKLNHTHNMTAHPASAATCTENGNTPYWECTGCHKYFSDENGATEIEANSWVIPATGHTSEAVARTNATTTTPAKTAGHKCSVCGAVIDGCEEIALAPVTDLMRDAETADLTFKRPINAADGMSYAVSYSKDGVNWTRPFWMCGNDCREFDSNGQIPVDFKQGVLGRMLTLPDSELNGTYIKARVETTIWDEVADGSAENLSWYEMYHKSQVIGVVEKDVEFTFNVTGDPLNGSLTTRTRDNGDKDVFYKLASGNFEGYHSYEVIDAWDYNEYGTDPWHTEGCGYWTVWETSDEIDALGRTTADLTATGTKIYVRSIEFEKSMTPIINVTPLGSGAGLDDNTPNYNGQTVKNLQFDNDTGEITFERPDDAYAGYTYCLSFSKDNGQTWTFPLQFGEEDFDTNGKVVCSKNLWIRNLMAFKDELLAGTYTKARVETCLWKDGSDDYYQSIEEVLGYRHIYGSFGCDVNFTFNVAGDALTGTLIKAQIQDNLDDYLFYTLNGGKTFNEDKEYWFIHTQKYDNRPDTFTGWRHTNSGNGFNEMKLWRWADFEEDAQGNYGLDRMWGIEPDTRVYAREFTVSGNIVTVTPLGSGASIPTERTVYDDSYAVQNLAIDSNGVITFATPTYQGNKNDLSYLVLMTDSNNKNWQFWCDGVSNMPTVSLTPKWLWSQVGENYEPPEGEYTFNNVSVLTYANPRRTHRVFAKKSMDISDATLKLNVNKSAEIYRIDCDTESHTMTLNLRNMPAELVSVLAWACEHPNDNNSQGKVILSVSYGTYWDEGRARSQSVKNNMVQLDANGNAVKVILSNYLDGDDALIAGCEEASMWYMTFTVTDESGNVTAYVTNIFCHGDVDIDELANDGIGRVLGGSNLAY